jgi:hypothetical protein
MSHQNERPALPESREGIIQLQIQLRVGARLWAWIAPGITGAIICTNASKSRNARLNEDPIEGKITKTILDNDRRAAGSRAIDVKAVTVEVHHCTWLLRRRLLCWRSRGNRAYNHQASPLF